MGKSDIRLIDNFNINDALEKSLADLGLSYKHTISADEDTLNRGDWLFEPVDFVTYCESRQFLGREGGIVPSKNQYRIAFAALNGEPDVVDNPKFDWISPDPKNVFISDRIGQWVAVVAGKGGGKDFITARIVSYCLYLLTCLRDPQQYLTGYSSNSSIDIINVSQVGRQAKRIFFEYLKNNIKNCAWFRENFRIRDGSRFIGDYDSTNKNPIVDIQGTSIRLPNNIRAFAETSNFEASEGYNTLIYILDECCENQKSLITDVLTNEVHTIEEWSKLDIDGINLYAYDEENDEVVLTKSKKPFYEGHGKIYEVELEDGKKIEVAAGHRFLTRDGWKHLYELKEGDEILTYGEEGEQTLE